MSNENLNMQAIEIKKFILNDLLPGFKAHRAWMALARRNVKALNRRSKLGSLWISLTAAVFITCLAFVYSAVLKTNMEDLLPYIAVGYVVWLYISGMLISMPPLYIQMAQYVQQRNFPYTVYVLANAVDKLDLMIRQSIVIVVVGLIFQTGLSVSILILPISLLLLTFISIGTSYFVSTMAVRYRDIGPLLNSFMLLIFLTTPIIWKPELVGDRIAFVLWNPFYHLINIIRAPILDHYVPWTSLCVSLFVLVLVWLSGIWAMSKYRNRIIFWI